MRIALDVSYVQKTRAGIGRHAYQLINAVLAQDTTNEYVLHGWSWGIDRPAISILAGHNAKCAVARIPGQIKRFYWNNLRWPGIESLLGNIEIFHSTDPFLPPTKARTVCTVYDLAYKKFPSFFESRVLAWDAFVQRSVHSADAVIVPSLQTEADLIEIMNVDEKKIHVVSVPVASIFSSTKSNADEAIRNKFRLERPYILYAGTIEPRKNIISIIKAFKSVPEQVDLVLVGKKGWHTDETFRVLHSFRPKGRIHYMEYVSDEDLASLYRQALCFVYPSFYEGYGFPVLEAMASGIPIITSDNSSMAEVADGVALLIDPSNVDELAEAMNLLVSDEVRRVEMRQRGLFIIQQYTAEKAAASVLNIYRTLAS